MITCANRPRRLRIAVLAILASAAFVVPLAVSASSAAAASTLTSADFDGRGWGHGRGMSQYGAQGYAVNHGWSSGQILDHYYGGTRAGSLSTTGGISIEDPNRLRIRLMALDNRPETVVGGSSESTLSIVEAGNPTVPTDASAVRMVRDGDKWQISTGPGCDGPWTDLGESAGKTVTIRDTPGTDGLFACRPDGIRQYAGWLRAQITDMGTRTINVTNIAEYLRGVVPNEVPASWHGEALKAQAVAARSYAMAGDTRHKDSSGTFYADTCDTTLCQVYKGRGGQYHSTNAAIEATAGVVREFVSSGNIARTEFSSTSGGWTAGGTFPAVEDLGDSISPVHTWTAENVSLTPLTSLGAGNLTGIAVTERNGLGADGGRVIEVRLDFDGQSAPVVVSGNTVRSKLGLRSDWFTIRDETAVASESGFVDVPDSSIYSDAVTWLVKEAITTGCTSTEFCPQKDITRAQAVTFLWRHAGEPTATSTQFSDVESTAFYADAVRWARDEAVTKGCTETEFCPNGSATRAQLVTFLWRHAGAPYVQGYHGFSDIPEGAYYEEAATWAVNEDITTGTSNSEFSPDDAVTRGQTAMLLHRYLG